MERLVRENERELEKKVWQEQEKQEEIELQKATPKQLIIHMDILTYHMLRPANEYIRRIEQANLSEKINLINQLAMYYRGRPHSIFRVNCLYILLSLLKKNIEFEGELYFKNIKELFEEVAFCNLTYFEYNSLSNSLCHLETTCCRLSKKISLKAYMDVLSKYVVDLRKKLSAEDLIARRPSVAGEMVRLIGMNGEFLWRLFSQENRDLLVWEGIWILEDFENIIDKLPEKKYPDNNSDLLFFESYGRGYDLLFMGSWMILNENLELLKVKNISPNIIKYALMDREKAIIVIPKSKLKPDDYKFSDQITDKMQGLLNTIKK